MNTITNKELNQLLDKVVSYQYLTIDNGEMSFQVMNKKYCLDASFIIDLEHVETYTLSDENNCLYLSEQQLEELHKFFLEKLEDKRYGDRQAGDLYEQMIHDICSNAYAYR